MKQMTKIGVNVALVAGIGALVVLIFNFYKSGHEIIQWEYVPHRSANPVPLSQAITYRSGWRPVWKADFLEPNIDMTALATAGIEIGIDQTPTAHTNTAIDNFLLQTAAFYTFPAVHACLDRKAKVILFVPAPNLPSAYPADCDARLQAFAGER
jgi:hypothetical protein